MTSSSDLPSDVIIFFSIKMIKYMLFAFAAVLAGNKQLISDDPDNTFRFSKSKTTGNPVLLIPGTGGSQMEEKLTNKPVPNPWCPKNTRNYRPLWIFPTKSLLPAFLPCWTSSFELKYNVTLRDFESAPGVHVRVPHFGKVDGIESVGRVAGISVPYYRGLIRSFEERLYSRNLNIRGAPYDFRFPVNPTWLRKTRKLVGEMADSFDKPVIIVSHSLGCLYTLKLLRTLPQEWVKRNVKHWVAIACPFAGVIDEMLIYASGDNRGISVVPHIKLRAEQRSSMSNLWMLPNPKYFKDTSTFVELKHPKTQKVLKRYFVHEMEDFLRDVGFDVGVEQLGKVRAILDDVLDEVPPVPTTCIFSTGVETRRSFVYAASDKNSDWGAPGPTTVNQDTQGDGVVTVESIDVCRGWVQRQRAGIDDVELLVLPHGISHMNTVSDKRVIEIIHKRTGE